MKKEETKQEFITIHSDVTIMVTPGLQHRNITNKDSRLENRMRVAPSWQKAGVLITKGKGIYPAEIAEWNTVKILIKKGVFTLSDDANLASEPEEKVRKAKADKKAVVEAEKEFVNLKEVADKGE